MLNTLQGFVTEFNCRWQTLSYVMILWISAPCRIAGRGTYRQVYTVPEEKKSITILTATRTSNLFHTVICYLYGASYMKEAKKDNLSHN
jgi:hypothetical protein